MFAGWTLNRYCWFISIFAHIWIRKKNLQNIFKTPVSLLKITAVNCILKMQKNDNYLYIFVNVMLWTWLINGSNQPEMFQTVLTLETCGCGVCELKIRASKLGIVRASFSFNFWLIVEKHWSTSSWVCPTSRNDMYTSN